MFFLAFFCLCLCITVIRVSMLVSFISLIMIAIVSEITLIFNLQNLFTQQPLMLWRNAINIADSSTALWMMCFFFFFWRGGGWGVNMNLFLFHMLGVILDMACFLALHFIPKTFTGLFLVVFYSHYLRICFSLYVYTLSEMTKIKIFNQSIKHTTFTHFSARYDFFSIDYSPASVLRMTSCRTDNKLFPAQIMVKFVALYMQHGTSAC